MRTLFMDAINKLVDAAARGYKINKLLNVAARGYTNDVRRYVVNWLDVNCQDEAGLTALMMASGGGHTETVKCLVDLKANVDQQMKDGWTALMMASHNGRTETVKCLVDLKANIDIQNKEGKTALDLASEHNYKDIVKYLSELNKADIGQKEMSASLNFGLALIDSNDVKLGSVLGEGGFGTVHMATHVNWGRVAVKRLKNVRWTKGLHKEAEKMLRSLTSPYLVRIMGLMKKPDGVDIVMEFFENGSLKEFEETYMRCECWARKIKMIQDIAYGMNFLHTLNPPITHCDLKLENVFVGNGFEAKIGDFGLAVSSTQSRHDAGSAGTISHMPPEAFDADVTPDEAWDIYTFGITTYELTTGRDPWPQLKTHANSALVAIWVGKGHRPNLEYMPKDTPVVIVDIIKSCWDANTKKRPKFSNILEIVTELFESKHEKTLRKADRAISEHMDIVQESSERQTQSADSGWGSLEACSLNEK